MTSDRRPDEPRWAQQVAESILEDVSPGDDDTFTIVKEPVVSVVKKPVTKPTGVRTVSGGSPGFNWLAGAAVALVTYFAFQATSTGAISWDSWWLGGHEPVLLWVICLLIVPTIAILLSVTSSKGLGRRWR